MIVTIDTSSKVPPYDQIRTAIARAVTDGELDPGTRLPTVRALAANLGLAPNTIARAYRELEAAGILQSHGRRGTFVAPDTPDATTSAEAAAQAYAHRAHALGLHPEDALHLVRTALGLQSEELIDQLAAMNPMNRLGTPEDIAETVAFLAGPARWVNGQTIFANGGMA